MYDSSWIYDTDVKRLAYTFVKILISRVSWEWEWELIPPMNEETTLLLPGAKTGTTNNNRFNIECRSEETVFSPLHVHPGRSYGAIFSYHRAFRTVASMHNQVWWHCHVFLLPMYYFYKTFFSTSRANNMLNRFEDCWYYQQMSPLAKVVLIIFLILQLNRYIDVITYVLATR